MDRQINRQSETTCLLDELRLSHERYFPGLNRVCFAVSRSIVSIIRNYVSFKISRVRGYKSDTERVIVKVLRMEKDNEIDESNGRQ